jgi:hypothetical protein
MVAWKRAVVTGERKAVARGRFQPERVSAAFEALIRYLQNGWRGAEKIPSAILVAKL